MAQASFAELEHDLKRSRTRRELFLEKMDKLVPWERLERRIEPFYAKAGRGRRPYPLSVMLRVHCVQLFYNLSDPGMEDLLYEVESVRRFVGLRLTEALPDETTILNFRHLLEQHGLGEGLFEEINAHLASRGHRLRTGTIVDASIIDAPSSTKNRRRARGHQTKKGKQWYFGMKAHIGVDAGSGLTHSLTTTAANARDVTQAGTLLHGGETTAWGDAGYQGGGEARRAPGRRCRVACGDEAGASPASGRGRRRSGGREAQGVGAGEGGASVPVREAALRLRQGALSGRGEEQAAHRLAAGVLEPADRRPLRDGMTGEQSARRWRDDGEGGGSTQISPLLSLSHDKNSPQPVENIVELQIQADSSPRSRRDGVVQTFLSRTDSDASRRRLSHNFEKIFISNRPISRPERQTGLSRSGNGMYPSWPLPIFPCHFL